MTIDRDAEISRIVAAGVRVPIDDDLGSVVGNPDGFVMSVDLNTDRAGLIGEVALAERITAAINKAERRARHAIHELAGKVW